MAKSSIFFNVKLSSKEEINNFLRAVEESEANIGFNRIDNKDIKYLTKDDVKTLLCGSSTLKKSQAQDTLQATV